jgi:hypothetical protein
MKISITIGFSDDQRRALASLIDGKNTKRKATRAECIEIMRGQLLSYLNLTLWDEYDGLVRDEDAA